MKKICVIDRFLLIFALILLLYTSVHLLFGMDTTQESNTIDIIVRTSLASIFGYFISSNFSKRYSIAAESSSSGSTANMDLISISDNSDNIRNRIGFLPTSSSETNQPGKILLSESGNQESSSESHSNTQVYIVASVGLLSLAILIAARHCTNLTPELTATISQLRDFVSACIGFLISCKKYSPTE